MPNPAASVVPAWRSRIVGHGEEAPSAIVLNDRNWRSHPKAQRQALAGVLDQVGWVTTILINRRTGRLVDGHLRVDLALARAEATVPVTYVDLSPEEEAIVLASLDPLAAMAGVDDEKLRELLADVSVDSEALAAMLSGIAPAGTKAGQTDPDDIPEQPDEATTKPGDLWLLGDHRLLCGDAGSVADLDRLLDGTTVALLATDPPYNVKVEPRSNNAIAAGLSSFSASRATHHQALDLACHPEKAQATHRKLRAKDRPLTNDFVTDDEFTALLAAWFGNASRVLRPGGAFYVWGGYANVANYPPALRDAGLYFSQAIIWVKEHPVLTRKDFMGNHEWCQPPGTRVLTPEGEVPIESLRDADRVVGYTERSAAITGLSGGLPIRTTSRPYAGELYGIAVGGAETWSTDGHLWTVRLSDEADRLWGVYLMRRGPWWRVGKVRLRDRWGFGLKLRMRQEGAEEGWILSVHDTPESAGVAEQIVSVSYGIPTTFWQERGVSRRTPALIARIYDTLDPGVLQASAERALTDHGRRVEFPLSRRGEMIAKVGGRVASRVRSCNLLPGAMVVPVPERSPQQRLGRPQPVAGRSHRFMWEPIRNVDIQPYEGRVYSMDVERFHHYIADGIVTHNCFYGWREGAAHRFFGPANVPDVWSVKKVNPASMVHLTEKPVELARLAIEYSSLPGDAVLDLFAGSGATLIAAEQTGRRGFGMEMDRLYCDVIVSRWEAFSGVKAERVPAAASEAA